MIASSVADLHSDNNKISKQTALTEKGDVVNGRTDTPNKHDMLTGSQADGTAFPGSDSANTTCGNWVRYFPMSGRRASAITIATATIPSPASRGTRRTTRWAAARTS